MFGFFKLKRKQLNFISPIKVGILSLKALGTPKIDFSDRNDFFISCVAASLLSANPHLVNSFMTGAVIIKKTVN